MIKFKLYSKNVRNRNMGQIPRPRRATPAAPTRARAQAPARGANTRRVLFDTHNMIILSCQSLENHYNNLKTQLEKAGFNCVIKNTKLIKKTQSLVFIITPSLLTYVPEKFFFYQVEQLKNIDWEQIQIIMNLAKKKYLCF